MPAEESDEGEDVGSASGVERQRRYRHKHLLSKEEERRLETWDRLSKPNRRFFLSLYENFSQYLSPQKMAMVRQKVQEEYCMSPEDTEVYFEKLREDHNKLRKQNKYRKRHRMRYNKRELALKLSDVQKELKEILKKELYNQFFKKTPMISTKRLQKLTDIVLEQLVEICPDYYEVPDKRSKDKREQFLIAMAEWIASGVESIYYDVMATNFRAPPEQREFIEGRDED